MLNQLIAVDGPNASQAKFIVAHVLVLGLGLQCHTKCVQLGVVYNYNWLSVVNIYIYVYVFKYIISTSTVDIMNLAFVYLCESQYFSKLEKPDIIGNPGWATFWGHGTSLYFT